MATLTRAPSAIPRTRPAKTGRSERSVQREAQRGADIPNVAELAGTSLDKSDELDAMAKLPRTEKEKLAERAKAGEKVSAKTEAKKTGRSERSSTRLVAL